MKEEEKIVRRFMPGIIRRYRDQANLSQQQLADSVGVSKGFIAALEGGRRVPDLRMLIQIADALGVRPGVLIDALVEKATKDMSRGL